MRSDTTRFVGSALLSLMLAVGVNAQAEQAPSTCPSVEALGFTQAARPESQPVTVVKRVNRARVTVAQARRITMLGPVLSLVTVSGTTLRAIPGNSLWELSNGGYAIFDSEPTANAMQVWTKDMGDGDLYVRACLCPGYNPNVDDGCRFSDGGNPSNPGSCSGNTCCGIVEGVILNDGTPITF